MELMIDRKYKGIDYVISNLYIDGKKFGYILEDIDRGLRQGMQEATIRREKIYGKTAIPSGRYKITLSIKSPRFGKQHFYKKVCEGYLPRLENVTGFDGVLIHVGNHPKDTEGCLLVGLEKGDDMILKSKSAFKKLYPLLKEADDRNEEIWIQVG